MRARIEYGGVWGSTRAAMLPSLAELPADAARKAVPTEADGEEGRLTLALKRTSLVPTGACLPRGFDPDYCAYDRYYTIGVALVSATLGVLADSKALAVTAHVATKALNEALGRICHVPDNSWFAFLVSGQDNKYHQMTGL